MLVSVERMELFWISLALILFALIISPSGLFLATSRLTKIRTVPYLSFQHSSMGINTRRMNLGTDALAWDDALLKGTQEFQHHSYSLFTCNCHSFVANNLNRLGFHSGGWNVVNLATLIFLKGQWVSTGAMVRSYLPFVVVCGFGLIFGGMTFLTFLAFFTSLLVGWFLLGTYCFKDLIQL
ncbi:hypothetical protein OIU74_004718 [Salix koriyanagi]|uniref:Protein RTE1-HOMOLOG n=1 Tax=Salix koriyanagi TaxID=2511006 RepID=A0A9Q0ZFS9_9ROSI|nr:hypothetical protein OIU74_004718 [Salix koriyanagi]